LAAERLVRDKDTARAHGPDGMRDVGWDSCGGADAEHTFVTIDREGDLTVDDVPDFFLRMVMFVQRRRVGGDVPVREGHVLGVEEPSCPARERAAVQHLGGINERHSGRLGALVDRVDPSTRIVVGDFKKMTIVRRRGLYVENTGLLPNTANNLPAGERGLFATARIGSDVIVPNFFRYQANT